MVYESERMHLPIPEIDKITVTKEVILIIEFFSKSFMHAVLDNSCVLYKEFSPHVL